MHPSQPLYKSHFIVARVNKCNLIIRLARALLSILVYLLAGAIPVLGALVGWWLPLVWR